MIAKASNLLTRLVHARGGEEPFVEGDPHRAVLGQDGDVALARHQALQLLRRGLQRSGRHDFAHIHVWRDSRRVLKVEDA